MDRTNEIIVFDYTIVILHDSNFKSSLSQITPNLMMGYSSSMSEIQDHPQIAIVDLNTRTKIPFNLVKNLVY